MIDDLRQTKLSLNPANKGFIIRRSQLDLYSRRALLDIQ